MAFLPAIVEITDENGVRVDQAVAGNQAPIRLVLGSNIQGTASTNGGLTEVRLDASGGSSSIALADHDAFRALALVDLSNNEVFQFTSPPGTFVYDTTSGAGIADDDQNVLRNTNVLLGANGRAYNVNTSAILPSIAALRLATWSTQNTIHVQNYAAVSDNGGGVFDYDASDTTSTDDSGVVIVAGTRRYKRRFAGTVEAAWFGGIVPKYYNPANGKLCTDVGLIVESRNDVDNIQKAIDYAFTLPGGGNVHVVGDYYAKTTQGTYKQFLVPRDGVSLFGDGWASSIMVSPGHNTMASGGYSGIFGTSAAIVANRDITVQGVVFDGNSDFNQFTPDRGSVTYSQNSACAILEANNVHYRDCYLINSAGVFGFNQGTYGFPEDSTNNSIVNCHASHMGDDPNAGDTSVFACGSHKYTVSGCSVDGSGNAAFPDNGQPCPCTAFEMHGENLLFFGNRATRMLRLLNCGGDSYKDVIGFNVYGNTADQCLLGLTFFVYAGRSIFRSKFHDNIFNLVSGVVPYGEAGIDTAPPDVIVSNPDGNGFEDCEFYGNAFTLLGAPTAGDNSVGIRLISNCKRVKIHHNTFKGWGSLAITLNAQRQGTEAFTRSGSTCNSAGHTRFNDWEVRLYSTGTLPAPLQPNTSYWIVNSVTNVSFQLSATRGGSPIALTTAGSGTHYCQGNIFEDIEIHDNKGLDTGVLGVQIRSGFVEVTPSHRRIHIHSNDWSDSGPGDLDYGTYIYAPTDHTVKVGPNNVSGFAIAEHHFDTASYPGIGNLDHLHVFMASTWGVSVAASAAVNGAAIQKAIDWISDHGGGVLAFNKGLFLSTPIDLKSGVYLKGAGHGFYGFSAGTTIQVAGTTAAFTAAQLGYFGLIDLAVYTSDVTTGADCVKVTTAGTNTMHPLFRNCQFTYNGTAVAGIFFSVTGAANIYFPLIENCDFRGAASNVGNAGVKSRSSSTGGVIRMTMRGGNITAVERGLDLEVCSTPMVDSVSMDNCVTGTSTGRYIRLGTASNGGRFTNMGLEIFPAADKAVEFGAAANDNYVSCTMGGAPAGWFDDTAGGSRNGWSGSDGSGAGGGVQDKHPWPTTFAALTSFAVGLRLRSNTGELVTSNAGTPESAVTAPIGSVCVDRANGEIYVKHSGAGNTGWRKVAAPGTPASAYQSIEWDGTDWFFLGVVSSNITDASTNIDITNGNQIVAPPGLFTNNRTTTVQTTGTPVVNEVITFVRRDVTAHTWTIANGGAGGGNCWVLPNSLACKASIQWDGTNWNPVAFERMN